MTIKLSASSMNTFFACPMAYWLGKNYKPAKVAQHFIDGTHVHALMEGKDVREASQRAKDYYNTLKEAQELWEIVIDPAHHEIEQRFEIYPGVDLHRIIDAIGFIKNIPILIDWKTASTLDYWNSVPQANTPEGYHHVSPKASGFQALAYLYPPPDEELKRLGLDEWPTTIYFVVGDPRGNHSVFPYSKQEGDDEGFLSAARIMAGSIKQGLFPRVRGDNCHAGEPMQCSMLPACFETKGWEKLYVEKSQDIDEPTSNNGN